MNEDQRAAFIVAQAAMLNARIAGMEAENRGREHRGEAPAYVQIAFEQVIGEFSVLDYNNCIAYLQGR
jgi:hypothetical protein